ncbi:hypothetical protein [Streptosporangium sp. NPDC051022]|uniref:hypothetical protein n=1 Tax=Streptosporangium sp. NPDC051022 TaxID=3155752 RepID=UPI0034169279
MTLPRAKWRTLEEQETEERRVKAHAFEQAAREVNGGRAARAETASPYDMVADALTASIVDAVFAAIYSPEFAAALEERGLRVGPVLGEEPPAAPVEWVERVLGFMSVDGTPVEPVELADELWAEAYRAGWEAARAGERPAES